MSYRTYGKGYKDPVVQAAYDELFRRIRKWWKKNVKFSWFRLWMVSNPPFKL